METFFFFFFFFLIMATIIFRCLSLMKRNIYFELKNTISTNNVKTMKVFVSELCSLLLFELWETFVTIGNKFNSIESTFLRQSFTQYCSLRHISLIFPFFLLYLFINPTLYTSKLPIMLSKHVYKSLRSATTCRKTKNTSGIIIKQNKTKQKQKQTYTKYTP